MESFKVSDVTVMCMSYDVIIIDIIDYHCVAPLYNDWLSTLNDTPLPCALSHFLILVIVVLAMVLMYICVIRVLVRDVLCLMLRVTKPVRNSQALELSYSLLKDMMVLLIVVDIMSPSGTGHFVCTVPFIIDGSLYVCVCTL